MLFTDKAKHFNNAVAERESQEGKSISRLQMSIKGIGTFCGINVMTPHYIEAFSSALLSEGWCLIQISNTAYGFLRLEKASKFKKISSAKMLGFIETKEEA